MILCNIEINLKTRLVQDRLLSTSVGDTMLAVMNCTEAPFHLFERYICYQIGRAVCHWVK